MFEAAYSHWPKKVEKKKSFDAFKRACRRRDQEELITDIQRFGEAYAATTPQQFVPALVVWLNGERWTDELPQHRDSNSAHQRAYDRQNTNLSVIEQMRAMDEADEQRGLTA